MSTGVVVLLVAVVVAVAVGLALRARSGQVRAVAGAGSGAPGDPELAGLLVDAGVPDGDGPVLLHFSADWCGPCARVRPVVDRVGEELPALRHAEVDVAEHDALAKRFTVLSLPTVVVLDRSLEARWRVTGVPNETDLVEQLRPLLEA
ncbi:thioredoxin family protein [Rhodococcus aerolatus]